ncbi:MAG: hypothetical protein H5T50_10160, partial [Nitrososphaeria archaeon]|nr:hypothetical protein [Nitrososphaeria archaeon]
GKPERILKLKREWIIDDEYAIQEYFCDLSNQLDKDSNAVDYSELLNVLEVNFQNFIEKESKKFEDFLNKIKFNRKEAKKILLGYICKNLKELGKLNKKDVKRINNLVERYLKVIFNVNIEGKELNNYEMEKIFKLLFEQKRILELEVFRYISKLGYPCIPNATIKTVDERFPEFDIIVLTNSGIKLVEVTAYGEPKEKISEKKENQNKLAISQTLPIIFVCNVSEKEECPKKGLYTIPFKDLNMIGDLLKRG